MKWSGLWCRARGATTLNTLETWRAEFKKVETVCISRRGRAAIYQIRNHMYHARRSLQADKSSAGAFNCGCKGVIDPAVRSG